MPKPYCFSGDPLTIQPETRAATLTGITWAPPSTLLTTATNTTILAIAWTSISLLGRLQAGSIIFLVIYREKGEFHESLPTVPTMDHCADRNNITAHRLHV